VRSKYGDHSLTAVSNLISILELKQKYIEKVGDKELKPDIVRMFVLGKEMKDDLFLYSYDIMDEITIQVMVKK
jgi:5-formaminoimidazole-4-carboxamide-1-beta-D-ribofuranosyl 5'-monophosphate synthetase